MSDSKPATPSGGDIDDTSGSLGIGVDAQKKKPKDEHHLEYKGYECPQEYVNDFTPMEFEEMVEQFEAYDVDGNGTLDQHEVAKILHEMEMDFSIDAAKDFLTEIDEDGSGLLEFKEFAAFIAKVKGGNPKYVGFTKLSNTLNATPVSLLEDQAKQRNFKVKFELVEEREETSMHPKFYVMEVHLTGTWHELDKKGQPSVYKGMKRFQGIGHTTREAKFKSVNAALSKLRALMPGLKFKPGEIPEDWFNWTLENMKRGCEVEKLLRNLAIKGFQAAKNPLLMHRVMAAEKFRRLREFYPDLFPSVDHMHPNASSDNPAGLPEEWQQFIDESLQDGIDGYAIIEALREAGVELAHGMLRNDDGTRMGDRLLMQKLLRNEGAATTDTMLPKLRDFHLCCATGALDDVKLYVSAGVDCDGLEPGRTTSAARTGLGLAAANGHVEVCEYIISEGKANFDQRDNVGRTALHHAAKAQQPHTLQAILDLGANMHLVDNYGNTPFHAAARSGSPECVEVLANHEEENLRQVLSGKVFVSKDGKELMGRPEDKVEGVTTELFHKMIREKMKRSEAQRFLKDWCFETAERVYGMVKTSELKMIGPPTKVIMDHALERFDPDPDAGFWVGPKGNERWVRTVSVPAHLIQILSYTFKHCFVDAANGMKRTALHEACYENRCGSHAEAIRVIVDYHRSNTHATDMHGRTPYELLLCERARLGEPSGSALRESVITERRKDLVDGLRSEEIKKENEEAEKRLSALLESCCKRGTLLDADAWGMMREISEHLRTYGEWMEMEDGDTKNTFYVRKVPDPDDEIEAIMAKAKLDEEKKDENKEDDNDEMKALEEEEAERAKMREKRLAMKAPDEAAAATWERPFDFNHASKIRESWSYVLQHSTFERKCGPWDIMADTQSGEAFFKNSETEVCQWNKPYEATWDGLVENSHVVEELGLHGEWEMREDNDGNIFYVRDSEKLLVHLDATHRFINLYFEHKSISGDSVSTTVVVQKDTSVPKSERKKPGTDSLEELSEEDQMLWREKKYRWELPPEALNKAKTKEKMDKMRKKHKVKFLHDIKIGKEEADRETEAAKKRDEDTPVQLAFVPMRWPDGKFKLQQGWALCRKVTTKAPIKGWQVVIDPEVEHFISVGASVMAEKEGHFGMFPATVTRQVTPLYYDIQYSRDKEEEEAEKLAYEKAKKSAKLAGRKKPPPPPSYVHDTAKCMWRGKMEPEGKEFWAHVETGASSWFPPREVAAVLKGEKNDAKDADIVFYPWPALSAAKWNEKRHIANSTLRRVLAGWEEYTDRETNEFFYVNIDMVKKEDAVLLLQRSYKQRFSKPIPKRWESQAYSWVKPDVVAKAERDRQGWAVLRRRSNVEREVTDLDGLKWQQFADTVTGERFFFCDQTGDSQWETPKLPDQALAEKKRNSQAELKLMDKVYYRFPGLKHEKLCVITRIRQDDETHEYLYDFAVCSILDPNAPIKRMIPSQKREDQAKWVSRGLIRQAPKTAEEVKIEIETELWTHQLRRSAARDVRVEARQKEIEAEEARLKRRGGRKKADRKMLSAEEVEAARKRRIESEKAVRDEEERKKKEDTQNQAVLAAAAKAGASVAAVEAQKRGGGLSGAVAKAAAVDVEAKARMDKAKAESERQFNERKNTLEARLERERMFERYLSGQEDRVTTPRTQSRRRVLRIVHRAMLRQSENFVICEWGCGEWVKMGQQQHFHETSKCRKRIIPCTLGCPLKHTEEDWMSLQEGTTITVVQYHEEVSCPRRLVPCTRRCGEWVAFSDLDVHLRDLCVKRPFPELYCRLGCGETFSGGAHRMLQCEEERLEHENEMCPLRLCRCSWKGCVALVRAKDRDKHRHKHIKSTGITVYPQPGVYIYTVPEKVFQLKVQIWGGGGGSGHIKKYQGGDGGGAGFVEALLSVVPREKLELCVGQGGAKGVYGTQVEVESWDGSEVNLEDRYGTAIGGQPGGGEGHGGNKIWACGGGGGYSIVQRRGALGLEPLLVASGGGGGGSREGVPGGGEDGELTGVKIDVRNGRMGRSWCGGGGGDSGDVMGCKFPPQSGGPWKGGNGGEYGGGGGGGLFGGGGGGTSPGIVGGGGGGSCYVSKKCVSDNVIIQGLGRIPGGASDRNIPPATGVGEWDLVGGTCGEGGKGDSFKLEDGRCGCIILYRPGFYEETL